MRVWRLWWNGSSRDVQGAMRQRDGRPSRGIYGKCQSDFPLSIHPIRRGVVVKGSWLCLAC